ncbi:aldehyde dehydrogenase family protein [Roseovarius sp.]|uniref:aldehyde dehydrogenase family protein n=1 Tax=Roseovarius sp. TaxID=1486281 RepID=UPI003A97173F
MSQAIEISQPVRATLERLRGKYFVDGALATPASGDAQATTDPATGEALTQIARATAAEVDQAVRSARQTFEGDDWARMRPSHRQRLINRLADLLEQNIDELAELETLDNGKPFAMAKNADVRGSIEYLRYVAGWATKIEGSVLDVSFPKPRGGGDYFGYTQRRPVGVVAAIVPWNFPLNMAVWKIGPALATGCTVVLKPASETPLTALRLAELIVEAGFPAGVVNVVTGSGSVIGDALTSHPLISKVTFTGSTEVGRHVGLQAMKNLNPSSLELGGKSPVIVFDDADIKSAIAGAASAIFFNQGETCTAGSRLYVQKSVYDEFIEGVAERGARMKIGHGMDPETRMGPLISASHRASVLDYVQKGVSEGAKVISGGAAVDGPGYFMQPTVLASDTNDNVAVREEIFGPVLVAIPFDDEDHAVALANESEYGLAASVWSSNLHRVHRTVPRIDAGIVWVNCHNLLDPNLPFGGVKNSGIGREMGKDVLDAYTEKKSVLMTV